MRWLLFLVCFSAWAAPTLDTIEVTAVSNPVEKSYRRMVRGMAIFEKLHSMAPQASLRYRLYPRKAGTDLDRVALHVAGETVDLPVALSADRTFTLTRSQKALDEDAAVTAERRALSMTWRADIRSPGLPPDMRRLGDLRLECRVGMEAGLVSVYRSLIGSLLDLLENPGDFCTRREVPYLFFAERPVFGVTLRSGNRSMTLPLRDLYAGIVDKPKEPSELAECDCQLLLARSYELPLGDQSWPDDTLVELEYMDSVVGKPAKLLPEDDYIDTVIPGARAADVRAALGPAKAVHFDNGYELWRYAFGPRKNEFLVLVDPQGIVAKTRP